MRLALVYKSYRRPAVLEKRAGLFFSMMFKPQGVTVPGLSLGQVEEPGLLCGLDSTFLLLGGEVRASPSPIEEAVAWPAPGHACPRCSLGTVPQNL